MNARAKAVLVISAIVIVAWGVWLAGERQPSYQGKSLSAWLEEYNKAGAMDEVGPASEAIRTMGADTLPFLIVCLKHKDSKLKLQIWAKTYALAQKCRMGWFPSPRSNPYRSPALYALRALGPKATPAIPDLLKMFLNPETSREGGLGLFSIGPASIPALQEACHGSNTAVRISAAEFLAILPLSYNSDLKYFCIWQQPFGCLVLQPPVDEIDLLQQARNDQKPGVRRASLEAIVEEYHRSAQFARFSKRPLPFSSPAQRFASPHLLRMLRSVTNDPDASVRTAAITTLNELQSGETNKSQ